MHPTDPVVATSHPNPYPYYGALLRGPALARGAQPGHWIASHAATIAQVLAHPDCLVRPVAEAVPAAIAGGSAGAIFGRLARMTEGGAHQQARRALAGALADIDPARVRAATSAQARMLAQSVGPGLDPDLNFGLGPTTGAALTQWIFDLPTRVVADLLGVAHADMAPLAREVAAFVGCLSPLSDAAQLTAADNAANALLARFTTLLRADATGAAPASLLARVRADAALTGWDDHDALVANVIGLLSQTHEATAGLIGNSVVALAQRPPLLARLRGDPHLADALVREVARFDPPVQNTRRFVARACTIDGAALAAGDTIVLLLAATGRDPALHARADEIDLERAPTPIATFGQGRHACPGQQLALTIASAAVAALLATPLAFDTLRWTYRPSANARLPLFIQATQATSEARP